MQPGEQYEYPARALRRPQPAPRLPRQELIRHRETASTGTRRSNQSIS